MLHKCWLVHEYIYLQFWKDIVYQYLKSLRLPFDYWSALEQHHAPLSTQLAFQCSLLIRMEISSTWIHGLSSSQYQLLYEHMHVVLIHNEQIWLSFPFPQFLSLMSIPFIARLSSLSRTMSMLSVVTIIYLPLSSCFCSIFTTISSFC